MDYLRARAEILGCTGKYRYLQDPDSDPESGSDLKVLYHFFMWILRIFDAELQNNTITMQHEKKYLPIFQS